MLTNEHNFIESYLSEVRYITHYLDKNTINSIIDILADTRDKGGRVFVLGLGGSAGNASHMVNDLRKLCNIDAYAPTDNVSELTARTNDDGFATIFTKWLEVSNLNNKDCLFVLSVGGGSLEKNISMPLVTAIDYAHSDDIDAMVLGICGSKMGYLATHGDYVAVVPIAQSQRITPHSEEFQSVIWHCIVTSPKMARNKTTW